MVDYVELVTKFVKDLQVDDICESHLWQGDFVEISCKKFLIIVYFPNTKKRDFSKETSVVHLDIDVLLASYEKVLYRIKGLHNIGKRIYARQTVVARVDKKVCIDFQNEHHLQTAMPGKYRYGLYDKGELVSLAVFSGGRNMNKESEEKYRSFELIRFCHKRDVSVIGGLSKLIKSFAKDFKPNDIMTYVDKDWSQKSSLETIGFEEVGELEAREYFIKNGVRYNTLQEDGSYEYSVFNRGSIKLKLHL